MHTYICEKNSLKRQSVPLRQLSPGKSSGLLKQPNSGFLDSMQLWLMVLAVDGWVVDMDLPITTLQHCKWLQLLQSVLSWQ